MTICPISCPDGDDFPWHVDQLVAGEAAMVEDVAVGLEDAVEEPVVAHELPDVLILSLSKDR